MVAAISYALKPVSDDPKKICAAFMIAAQDRAKARRDVAWAVKQIAISDACRTYFPNPHTRQTEVARNVACAAADAGYAAALSTSEQLLQQDRSSALATLTAFSCTPARL
jgi:hypothetical protein